MLHTEGIVLRTTKYGESSLILDVLTKEKGLLSFIIGGVRNKKSNIKGLIQLMSIIDFVSYYSDRKILHRIKEVKMNYVYLEVPYDAVKRSIGVFILEVIRNAIKETEYHPEMYDFIRDTYTGLDQSRTSLASFHLLFMMQFTHHLGCMPTLPYSDSMVYFDLINGVFSSTNDDHDYYLDMPKSSAFHKLLQVIQDPTSELTLNKEERSNLLQNLIEYFQIHLEHFKPPHSHHIFKEIFS